MSEVIELNQWRRRRAEGEAQADSQRAECRDEEWALKFSWEAREILYGDSEVSSYLRVPLRTFERALQEIEAKRGQDAGE